MTADRQGGEAAELRREIEELRAELREGIRSSGSAAQNHEEDGIEEMTEFQRGYVQGQRDAEEARYALEAVLEERCNCAGPFPEAGIEHEPHCDVTLARKDAARAERAEALLERAADVIAALDSYAASSQVAPLERSQRAAKVLTDIRAALDAGGKTNG